MKPSHAHHLNLDAISHPATDGVTANIHHEESSCDEPGSFSTFPAVNEMLDGCLLIAEIGAGSNGRAFLAQERALGNRPVVLKVTDLSHDEHLNLARLQHTNIMPIFWANREPGINLRVIAMPFLARTTLFGLLQHLDVNPIDRWDGTLVAESLRKDHEGLPIPVPRQDHLVVDLKKKSWVEFVTGLGRTLAQALAYAHQRDVIHLDIKPTNILISPDGQPYLLDLDVARQPLRAGESAGCWLGGTPAYMSPEQRAAMHALNDRQPIPHMVDSRSDIYSLGLVLFEALGGRQDDAGRPILASLRQANPRVPPDLADVLARCLALDPAARYPNCQMLADDLDRCLHDRPLIGVRNRLSDRWRKWRRRRPLALPLLLLLSVFLATASVAGVSVLQVNRERRAQAENALIEGQEWHRQGMYQAAGRCFQVGLQAAEQTYDAHQLQAQLRRRLRISQRLERAAELAKVVHLMRFFALQESTPDRTQYVLEAAGRKIWADRALLTDHSDREIAPAMERQIAAQLQELVLLWCDVRMRLAPATHRQAVRAEVVEILAETERIFGQSLALHLARERHAGQPAPGDRPVPRAAWEFCTLARTALEKSDPATANQHLQKALELEPLDFVPNFYAGIAALRSKDYARAIQAFSFCVGQNPCPECFLLRAEALAARGDSHLALRDLTLAIAANPSLALGYERRAQIYRRLGRNAEAARDVEMANRLRK